MKFPPPALAGTKHALKFLSVSLSTAVLATASQAAAFSETFESYAPGSDIVGQGGWIGAGGPMLVSMAGPLPTNVLDGVSSAPNATQHFAGHALAAPVLGQVTVFAFDGFASNSSHNSWVGLAADPTGALTYAVLWDFVGGSGWQLEIREDGQSPVAFIPGIGANTVSRFQIFFDRMANQVWGTYDTGGGTVLTPQYAFASASFDQLDTINVSFDYRGTRGIQVDNLQVSTVPEPSTALLLVLGAVAAAVKGSCARRVGARQA